MRTFLCRYGELTIKGANRVLFERCLTQNIRAMLHAEGISADIHRKRGRTFVTPRDAQQYAAAIAVLQRVFGLTSVSPATAVPLEYQKIESAITELLTGKSFATFAVRAQRLQKVFDQTPEIHRKLGKFVEQTFKKKVNLDHPDLELGIEIIDQAYLFTERFLCPGGLPHGIEGTVLALVESNADLLAAWLVMKRGCAVIPIQRHPFPLDLLRAYGCTAPPIPINHLNACDAIAHAYEAQALVVGQMSETLAELPIALPQLRPLVGYTPSEITRKFEDLCIPLSKK